MERRSSIIDMLRPRTKEATSPVMPRRRRNSGFEEAEVVAATGPSAGGEKPSNFVGAEVELSSRTRAGMASSIAFSKGSIESFGTVGLVYRTEKSPTGVLLHFKDIGVVRIEDKNVFALVLLCKGEVASQAEKNEILVRKKDSAPLLAMEIGKWIEFATGRPLDHILLAQNSSKATLVAKSWKRTPTIKRSSKEKEKEKEKGKEKEKEKEKSKGSGKLAKQSEKKVEDEDVEVVFIPEECYESIQFNTGSVVEEVFVEEEPSSFVVLDPDDDAQSTTILEMLQSGDIPEKELSPNDNNNDDSVSVMVCGDCGEVFPSAHEACPFCSEVQM